MGPSPTRPKQNRKGYIHFALYIDWSHGSDNRVAQTKCDTAQRPECASFSVDDVTCPKCLAKLAAQTVKALMSLKRAP